MASLDPDKIRQIRRAAEPKKPRFSWLRLDRDDRAALEQVLVLLVVVLCVVALLLLAALTAGLMVRLFQVVM